MSKRLVEKLRQNRSLALMEELADNSDRQIISLGVRFVSSRYNRVDQGNTHYLLPGVGGGRFFSVGRDHMVFREN